MSRALIRTVAVVGSLILVGWLADSAVAMRVESRLSRIIEHEAELATSPDVFVGGFPYTSALVTGEIPTITVTSLDINVEDLGIVNARTEIRDIKVSPDEALGGEVIGKDAALFTRLISLDGVAFGKFLDMTDLIIANPYDISPAGGVATEAQLTGTPPGFDEQVTAVVSLRLVGPEFRMEVHELLDAPEGREADAREAFTFHIDTRKLPLRDQASSVEVSGGSIVFSSQRHGFTVTDDDLAPLDFGDAATGTDSAWSVDPDAR